MFVAEEPHMPTVLEHFLLLLICFADFAHSAPLSKRHSSPPTPYLSDEDEDTLDDLQMGSGAGGRVTHEQTQALYDRARAKAFALTAKRSELFAASSAAYEEGHRHEAKALSAQV